MKVKRLYFVKSILVGMMTLLGLAACKKDDGQIVPMYGVPSSAYCQSNFNGMDDALPSSPAQQLLNDED